MQKIIKGTKQEGKFLLMQSIIKGTKQEGNWRKNRKIKGTKQEGNEW